MTIPANIGHGIGADLNAAVEFASRALAHWRDGDMHDCQANANEALSNLYRATQAMEGEG